jgi:hypothetical protein
VISPDVEVVDIDPEPWAEVHAAYQRARARSWVYVLHDGGTVTKVHGPTSAGPAVGDVVRDPSALARALRSASNVERVVVIDRTGLADVVRAAVAEATPERSLQEFRAAVDRHYWQSPAVATDPEPPRDPWPDIRAALAARGEHVIGLLVLENDGVAYLSVVFEIERGYVRRVSCLPDGGGSDPEAAASSIGTTPDLLLHAEWSAFSEAMAAVDALDAIADVIDAARLTRGLDGASVLLRAAGRP